MSAKLKFSHFDWFKKQTNNTTTENQTEMEPARVVLWSSLCVCLSLTILVIFCVCCLVCSNRFIFVVVETI